MCAICGILCFKAGVDNSELVASMMDMMQHRGPDSKGIRAADYVCLGHNRLSVIDVSSSASQPMEDPSGNYTLTFNGEIYNFQELKSRLSGYRFKTLSDTEVLLAAYITWGNACLNYIKGQFAFAVWNKANKSLFLARDHMGEKPLYYVCNDSGFFFSSEIRPLVKVLNLSCVPDTTNLKEYLAYQRVLPPGTLIKEVRQLPPGHYAFIKDGKLEISQYWQLGTVYHEGYDNGAEIEKNIVRLLSNSVSSQLISDVPLGAFLSGGLDSSVVVGLAAHHSSKRLKTFTIGFDEPQYDEREYAAIIAKKFNTDHTEIVVRPEELVQKIPSILQKFDVPGGDGINSYIVSEAVKSEGITVALSGLGGDELFAGYPGFRQFYYLQRYAKVFDDTNWLRRRLCRFVNGKQRELLNMKNISLESFNNLSRMVFLPEEIDALMESNDLEVTTTNNLSNLPVLGQYGVADIRSYTQPVLLKDSDQMGMAVSLEVRVPFFDKDVVEYALGIPDKYKLGKSPKELLFNAFRDLIPKEVYRRKKMGFTFPWNQWLSNELYDFSWSMLHDLDKRKIFKKGAVESVLKNYLSTGKGWNKIILLFTLESWLRQLDEL